MGAITPCSSAKTRASAGRAVLSQLSTRRGCTVRNILSLCFGKPTWLADSASLKLQQVREHQQVKIFYVHCINVYNKRS